MNIDTTKRIVEKNTLLLMYEPGGGGDFIASLLSVDPKIHGTDSTIDYYSNGRIKAKETQHNIDISKIINDYEFYENGLYFDRFCEQLLSNVLDSVVTSHSKYISKLHPYLNEDKNIVKLSNHIVENYQNSSKIMIVREHHITLKNHKNKNGAHLNDMYYSSLWKQRAEKLKTHIPDIHFIKFSDVIKNPILTMKKMYHIMGYNDNEISHNFSINTETIKQIYTQYMSNQQNLEDIKRYWE